MTVVLQVCPENITWPLPWPHNGVIFQEYTLLNLINTVPTASCSAYVHSSLYKQFKIDQQPTAGEALIHTIPPERSLDFTASRWKTFCRSVEPWSITKVGVWKQNEGLQRSTDTQQDLVCVIYHCTNDITSWNSVNPFTKHWLLCNRSYSRMSINGQRQSCCSRRGMDMCRGSKLQAICL